HRHDLARSSGECDARGLDRQRRLRRLVESRQPRLANRKSKSPDALDCMLEEIYATRDERGVVLALLERAEGEPLALELHSDHRSGKGQRGTQRAAAKGEENAVGGAL